MRAHIGRAAAHHVDLAAHGRGGPHVSRRGHGGPGRPGIGARIVRFVVDHVRRPVPTTDRIDLPAHGGRGMIVPGRGQGGPADPGVGDRIVLLVPRPGSPHDVHLAAHDRGGVRIAGRKHGLLGGPGVGQRVVRLVVRHGGPVVSSDGVHLASHGRGGQIVSRRGHGGPRRPCVGRRIILLVLREIAAAVVTAHHIDPAQDDRGRWHLPRRRRRGPGDPSVGDRVVFLVGAQIAPVETGQRVDLSPQGGGGQVTPRGGHDGLGGPGVARAPAGVDPVLGDVDGGLAEAEVGEGRVRGVGRGRDGMRGDVVEGDARGRLDEGVGGAQRQPMADGADIVERQHPGGVEGVGRKPHDRRVGVGGLGGDGDSRPHDLDFVEGRRISSSGLPVHGQAGVAHHGEGRIADGAGHVGQGVGGHGDGFARLDPRGAARLGLEGVLGVGGQGREGGGRAGVVALVYGRKDGVVPAAHHVDLAAGERGGSQERRRGHDGLGRPGVGAGIVLFVLGDDRGPVPASDRVDLPARRDR